MYLDAEATTPETYARQISYISNPSTIRARTMEEFGRAPSLDRIKEIQAERSSSPVDDEWDDDDGLDFQVKGLIKAVKPHRTTLATLTVAPIIAPQYTGHVGRTANEVIDDIAARMGLTRNDILGSRKPAVFVHARRLIASILRARGNSYPKIGQWMGGRDHSTVINLHLKFHETVKAVPGTFTIYEEYLAEIDPDAVEYARQFVVKPLPAQAFQSGLPCLCCDTGMYFPSLKDAAQWLRDGGKTKADPSAISKAIRNCSIAYGYRWDLDRRDNPGKIKRFPIAIDPT